MLFNSEAKLFLREQWNKPLIEFIVNKINDKLVYLGLPSPEAEDIKAWVGAIKIVIAFQCREYRSQSDPAQSREEIEKLNMFLLSLERKGSLESYTIYDGYLEEVVLRGYDNSPQRIGFSYSTLVTIFNFDFCNKIDSPITYVDEIGVTHQAYKFDAINKLLQFQKSISRPMNKFLLLLTVHCGYSGEELNDFLSNPPNAIIKTALTSYEVLEGDEKRSRIVRLFVCYSLNVYLTAHGFGYEILPIIKYEGNGGFVLLHFVVIGTHLESRAGITPVLQPIEEVINKKFLEIKDGELKNSMDIGLEEDDISVETSVNIFKNSNSYINLWNA